MPIQAVAVHVEGNSVDHPAQSINKLISQKHGTLIQFKSFCDINQSITQPLRRMG